MCLASSVHRAASANAINTGHSRINARRLITEQITTTVTTEVAGLAEQYERGGIGRLVAVVDIRSRRPGSSLYLVATPLGQGLAGNVASLDPGILTQSGWVETSYRRLDSPEGTEHHALVLVSELGGGFHLLVGRDIEERQRIYDIISTAGRWSIAAVVVFLVWVYLQAAILLYGVEFTAAAITKVDG